MRCFFEDFPPRLFQQLELSHLAVVGGGAVARVVVAADAFTTAADDVAAADAAVAILLCHLVLCNLSLFCSCSWCFGGLSCSDHAVIAEPADSVLAVLTVCHL